MSQLLSMFNAVSALDVMLVNLEHILKKGEADATSRDIAPEIFVNARLAPDMAPLLRQVQIACSMAKMAPYRITGQTPPVYEDTETSFAELYALIAKTRSDIAAVTRDQLDGQEGFEFTVKLGPKDYEFTAIRYLSGFIIPNVYFHITTAYNILRHNGVPLGKIDFMGGRV